MCNVARETTTPPDPCYPEPGSPEGRVKLVKLLWDHAEDATSRGCTKACDVLSQLAFAPEILAIQAKAKLEAAQLEKDDGVNSRPVVIRGGESRALSIVEDEVLDD